MACLLALCVLTGEQVLAAVTGKVLSNDYAVAVDGRNVEVVMVPTPENRVAANERHPYSYASFESEVEAEVSVSSSVLSMGIARVLPETKVVGAVTTDGDFVSFRMRPPQTLVVEPRGRHRALVISANRRCEPVTKGAKTKYYGPGYHRAGRIALGDGETLYLDRGAWVEGFVEGHGNDLMICGRGVLSGACWDWHKGPKSSDGVNLSGRLVTLSGERIRVKDVTLFSSWGWCLVFNAVTNALVENVKILGGRVINDDGIDICRAKDVIIRNSFIRSQDDCITPKYWCENLVVTNCTLWTDAANAFRAGFECEDGSTGLLYRDILVKDVDILHLSLHPTRPEDYWVECAICIQPSHDQLLTDILFEDIRFYQCEKHDIFLNVKTMPITQGSPLCRTDKAGILRNLTLRNIRVPPSGGGMSVFLKAHDEEHPIECVCFENVSGYGVVRKIGKVGFRVVDDMKQKGLRK